MPPPATISVALVEDDAPTREALRLLIDEAPDYSCVIAAGSFEEALPLIVNKPPDIVLLDIRLPGIQGPDGVKILRSRCPSVRVLMLTVYSEQRLIFESICSGASGYLLKKTPPARLLASIRDAYDGGAPLSPEIARKIISLFQQTPSPYPFEDNLTPQEARVLRLLAEGHQYQAAADALDITINTLRNYVRAIYDKLHVHSKSEAVAKALRQGIIR